ncbi:unnamed protein product [Pleuronectes platessa]|uniref:Uncharacterized protein n=1 Tax=Pleuronectes platessa TaxID=8262 RepID=A0A9N7VC25_PLEPL|nr:unnamed protein product [Pleuronectes platessa]
MAVHEPIRRHHEAQLEDDTQHKLYQRAQRIAQQEKILDNTCKVASLPSTPNTQCACVPRQTKDHAINRRMMANKRGMEGGADTSPFLHHSFLIPHALSPIPPSSYNKSARIWNRPFIIVKEPGYRRCGFASVHREEGPCACTVRTQQQVVGVKGGEGGERRRKEERGPKRRLLPRTLSCTRSLCFLQVADARVLLRGFSCAPGGSFLLHDGWAQRSSACAHMHPRAPSPPLTVTLKRSSKAPSSQTTETSLITELQPERSERDCEQNQVPPLRPEALWVLL